MDLDPVGLEDPAARAWLQACTPPEASALSRLTAAVDIARRHPEPVIAGDVIDALPGVLGSIPRQQRIIVVDAYAGSAHRARNMSINRSWCRGAPSHAGTHRLAWW